ncbi:hypothetical protein 1 [Beihai weivirus-like virus 15]|uniref:hypothetical protein 1 n=1 Tax=Beihai weivirus-like virus 15 TaxID=1922743 RepID=UPI000909FE18|nr:hypothetical protein 1 [Beihai weivirus-like virus 15]APG78115.1 hypothetical protein 1 [Beihai weivirus-like virus 15]
MWLWRACSRDSREMEASVECARFVTEAPLTRWLTWMGISVWSTTCGPTASVVLWRIGLRSPAVIRHVARLVGFCTLRWKMRRLSSTTTPVRPMRALPPPLSTAYGGSGAPRSQLRCCVCCLRSLTQSRLTVPIGMLCSTCGRRMAQAWSQRNAHLAAKDCVMELSSDPPVGGFADLPVWVNRRILDLRGPTEEEVWEWVVQNSAPTRRPPMGRRTRAPPPPDPYGHLEGPVRVAALIRDREEQAAARRRQPGPLMRLQEKEREAQSSSKADLLARGYAPLRGPGA